MPKKPGCTHSLQLVVPEVTPPVRSSGSKESFESAPLILLRLPGKKARSSCSPELTGSSWLNPPYPSSSFSVWVTKTNSGGRCRSAGVGFVRSQVISL